MDESELIRLEGTSGPDRLEAPFGATEGYYFLGLEGNDQLEGSNAADILDGGSGNNLLNGVGGDDIYRVAIKQSNTFIIDSIETTDQNTLVITDATRSELSFSVNYSEDSNAFAFLPLASLFITDAETGNSIQLPTILSVDTFERQTVVFADGESTTLGAILSELIESNPNGNVVFVNQDNALTVGTSADEVISAAETAIDADGEIVFGTAVEYYYTPGSGNDTFLS